MLEDDIKKVRDQMHKAEREVHDIIDEEHFYEELQLTLKAEQLGLRFRVLSVAKELKLDEDTVWRMLAENDASLNEYEDVLDLEYRSQHVRAINEVISSIDASRWHEAFSRTIKERTGVKDEEDDEQTDLVNNITADQMLNQLKKDSAKDIKDMNKIMRNIMKAYIVEGKGQGISTWVKAAEFDMAARTLANDFIHGCPPGLWLLAEEVMELIREENKQKVQKLLDEQ